MSSRGKKYLEAREKLGVCEPKNLADAIKAVIAHSFAKFDETVSLDINLGIDATKGDQVVRGAALLPHGTGKKVVVAAFVKGEHEDAAKAAGADHVGYEDLIEKVSKGWTEFDVAVATPDSMAGLSKLAKVLGPKGLLPNKKTGTVSFDVAGVVSDLKKGRVSFRNDKGGSVHVGFGKLSFGPEKLADNARALFKAITSSRPASAKGKFVKKAVLASTHGVGVPVLVEDVTG